MKQDVPWEPSISPKNLRQYSIQQWSCFREVEYCQHTRLFWNIYCAITASRSGKRKQHKGICINKLLTKEQQTSKKRWTVKKTCTFEISTSWGANIYRLRMRHWWKVEILLWQVAMLNWSLIVSHLFLVHSEILWILYAKSMYGGRLKPKYGCEIGN